MSKIKGFKTSFQKRLLMAEVGPTQENRKLFTIARIYAFILKAQHAEWLYWRNTSK